MRKRRKIDDHEHADRWVVSYADFVTLLFAFFTTLYAISHVDQGKLDRFTGSVKSAFKTSGTDAVNAAVIDGIKPANYADISLEKLARSEFHKFSLVDSIATTREDRGVAVSFGDTALFASGSADLRREALPLLRAVAALIKKTSRPVLIEGHTDNMPLKSSRYSSNLELSAARAANIFAYLVNEEAVPPERISTAGYGAYRPVASNATMEGRSRNRRVDIVFVSEKQGV